MIKFKIRYKVCIVKSYVQVGFDQTIKSFKLLLFLRVGRVFFFFLMGWALGGARYRNPICESFSPIRVLAVCVVGICTRWGSVS